MALNIVTDNNDKMQLFMAIALVKESTTESLFYMRIVFKCIGFFLT